MKFRLGLQVKLTIQVQIGIPLVMGIAAFFAHQVVSGIILIALAGVAALMFYLWLPPPPPASARQFLQTGIAGLHVVRQKLHSVQESQQSISTFINGSPPLISCRCLSLQCDFNCGCESFSCEDPGEGGGVL